MGVSLMDVAMLIIGLSVAFLAIFMIQTLRKAQSSLESAGKTLLEVQGAIHEWKGDVAELVGSAKKITDRVDSQLTAIDPLMATVREAGEALHEVAGVAHNFSSLWTSKLRRRAETAAAKEAQRAAEQKEREIEESYAIMETDGSIYVDMDSAGTAEAARIHAHSAQREMANAHLKAKAAQSGTPAWMEWMETGMRVARLIAKRS
ncbi:DUF948 domain-containing protein [Paenibacillus solisilvae]|uniref:DUF948 domain-containing protein n=1 Tax=Paenibacillus solisilvae TaxID=2486751 RepID=A0ABW0VTZ1_9BACL